jgi:hypothetical protein
MSARFFPKGKQGFVAGEIDWDAQAVRAHLIKLDGSLTDAAVKAVADCTDDTITPIVLTVTGHGWTDGDLVVVKGVGGNTAANGLYRIANQDTNTFELVTVEDSLDSVGNGNYTSGGCVLNLTAANDVADVDGAFVGTVSDDLGSKTNTNGVIDAADPASMTLDDTAHAMLIAENTGTPANDQLIHFQDGEIQVIVAADAAQSATTLWVRPLAGDLDDDQTMIFSNGVTATVNGAHTKGDRSITVDALPDAITAGHEASVHTTNGGFPIMSAGGPVQPQFHADGIGEI